MTTAYRYTADTDWDHDRVEATAQHGVSDEDRERCEAIGLDPEELQAFCRLLMSLSELATQDRVPFKWRGLYRSRNIGPGRLYRFNFGDDREPVWTVAVPVGGMPWDAKNVDLRQIPEDRC